MKKTKNQNLAKTYLELYNNTKLFKDTMNGNYATQILKYLEKDETNKDFITELNTNIKNYHDFIETITGEKRYSVNETDINIIYDAGQFKTINDADFNSGGSFNKMILMNNSNIDANIPIPFWNALYVDANEVTRSLITYAGMNSNQAKVWKGSVLSTNLVGTLFEVLSAYNSNTVKKLVMRTGFVNSYISATNRAFKLMSDSSLNNFVFLTNSTLKITSAPYISTPTYFVLHSTLASNNPSYWSVLIQLSAGVVDGSIPTQQNHTFTTLASYGTVPNFTTMNSNSAVKIMSSVAFSETERGLSYSWPNNDDGILKAIRLGTTGLDAQLIAIQAKALTILNAKQALVPIPAEPSTTDLQNLVNISFSNNAIYSNSSIDLIQSSITSLLAFSTISILSTWYSDRWDFIKVRLNTTTGTLNNLYAMIKLKTQMLSFTSGYQEQLTVYKKKAWLLPIKNISDDRLTISIPKRSEIDGYLAIPNTYNKTLWNIYSDEGYMENVTTEAFDPNDLLITEYQIDSMVENGQEILIKNITCIKIKLATPIPREIKTNICLLFYVLV